MREEPGNATSHGPGEPAAGGVRATDPAAGDPGAPAARAAPSGIGAPAPERSETAATAANSGDGSQAGLAGGAADPMAEARVAEVLQRLRSGVRQRTAETATAGAGAEELRRSLLAVRSREYLEEPVAFSHRRRLGRWIVVARKAFFHLFLKWFLRPVIAQQNAFNQAVGRLLEELAEAEERQLRELGELARRVEELEGAQRDAAAGPGER